jgi:hypothetical protein
MIPDDKLIQLLSQLLVRSRKDEVHWGVDPLPPKFPGSSMSFRVDVGTSAISIHFVRPPSDADFFLVRISNTAGFVVATKRVPVDAEGENEKMWLTLLQELYCEAERLATGWDKVLSELEQAVTSPSPVGDVPWGPPF